MDQPHPIGDSFSIRRAIAHGFLAIRIAAGPLWLAGLLMTISDGCGGLPPFDTSDLVPEPDRHSAWHALPMHWPWPTAAAVWADGMDTLVWQLLIAFALIVVVAVVALFALNCFLQTGFIRLHVQILTDASDSFAPMFSGKDRFWHMAGFKSLAFLALSGTAIAASWPGALVAYLGFARDQEPLMMAGVGLMLLLAVPAVAYVALGVYLGELAVALEGAAPAEALRRSWALARGNRLPLFAFALLCALIQFASLFGVILFCVGLLITMPLARSLTGFAKTEGYLLFTRGTAQTAGWKLWQRDLLEGRQQPVQGWGVPAEPPPAPAPPQPMPQPPPPQPSALPWEPPSAPEPPAARDDEPPPDWPPRPPKK
jgi:hypothetical protein